MGFMLFIIMIRLAYWPAYDSRVFIKLFIMMIDLDSDLIKVDGFFLMLSNIIKRLR